MVDNVTLDAGSGGAVVRTDDDGTAHWQYVKLAYGADNAQNIVGSISSNPLPVALSATDNAVLDAINSALGGSLSVDGATVTVDNGGTFAVQVDGAALTALQLIDNIVLAEDAAHQTGDSGVMALAVRQDSQADFGADGDYVPLSIDANGALRVSGGGGGTEYTEDDAAPANPVGGAILAERDDALGGLTPIEGDWSHLFVDANGALWTRINGTVTVDGSGVTQPVSGTVTANLGATDNAVLDSIDSATTAIQAAVETLDDIVSGAEAQVDVVTSALPTGAATAANQSTANTALSGIQTAVEILDNVVSGSEAQVDVVAALPAGTNNIGDVDIASAIPAGTNMIGRIEQNVSVSATGTSTYYDADLDETAVAVDAGAVNIYSIQAFNTTAAPLFLQLFNVASGSVTVGTTAPTNQYVIPGNADSDGAGFTITFGVPKSYGTALTIACTTDSEGNGAPGAGACIINIEYAT